MTKLTETDDTLPSGNGDPHELLLGLRYARKIGEIGKVTFAI
jgi:hypothetical protein